MHSPRLLIGDCREVLPLFEPETFDLIIADCPYGQTSLEWDRWVEGWPSLVRPLLKKSGSMWVFGSMRMFWDRRDQFVGWRLAQDLVWEKHNGSSFHADRFRRVHEHAIQLYRDDAQWNGVWRSVLTTPDATKRTVRRKKRPAHTGHIDAGHYRSENGGPRLMRSVIRLRSCHGSAVHPTEKPEGIIEPVLLSSCPPDGVVLDPFAGSGTVGVVAARYGRKSVLVEADPRYAAAAHDRISSDLFAHSGGTHA